MNRIIINGKSIQVSGRNINVVDDKVFVDGNLVEEGLSGNVRITFKGDLATLGAHGSVTVKGDVKGDIDAGGSVNCGNVEGSVNAGGSVRCRNVSGDVDAGGSIKMSR